MSDRRPTYDGIRNASETLRAFHPETPLVRCELLSRAFDADIFLKNETTTAIGTFKGRGAITSIVRARERKSVAKVVTSSSGNHGLGVAFAGHLLKVPTEVVLPLGANITKKQLIRQYGATIREVGSDIDEAKSFAQQYAEENGFLFVDDGESVDVIEGAGSVGYEIAHALSRLDMLFVPMGSGSLAAGCAIAAKKVHPSCQVIAVQSEGAQAMALSFKLGRPVSSPICTIADGLVCREPAKLALDVVLEVLDAVETVSDREILSAQHSLVSLSRILVEPSAAAALAAAWKVRDTLRGKTAVLVLTGANTEITTLRNAIASSPLISFERLTSKLSLYTRGS